MRLARWEERAPEEAHHFNPAFCGVLAFEFVQSYEKAGGYSSVYPLIFCALPVALHPETREALPHSTVTGMLSWVEDNTFIKVGYAERAVNLAPYIKEGIRFAIARQALSIAKDGELASGPSKANFTPKPLSETTIEVRETVQATRKIARWFAAVGSTPTIMAAWGVRA